MNVRCFAFVCAVALFFSFAPIDGRAQDFFQALGQAFGGGGGNTGGGGWSGGNRGGNGWGGGNRGSNGWGGGGGNWFDVTPRYEDGIRTGVDVRPNVGAIVEDGIRVLNSIPQEQYPQNTRPYHPQNNRTYPQNTFPRERYVPQNVVSRPAPKPVAPKAAAPKNVLVRNVEPPKNDPSLALTDLQQEATEDTAKKADELAATAEDQLVNDPSLVPPIGPINGDGPVIAAVEKFKRTGDSSDLEAIKNNPATPQSVKDKIDVYIDARNASDLIRNGGLNPNGTDTLIDKIDDKIANSNSYSTAEKIALGKQIGAMRDSNKNRKIVDALVASGAGGGSGSVSSGGATLAGMDFTSLDPLGPIFVEEPVEDATKAAVSGGTLLVNPEENGESVSYLLDDHPYTMQTGQSQRLNREYTIEFDRGGEYGAARYSLPVGTYEFTITDRGWDLRKKTYEATIDNSRYPGAFGYVLDNKQYTLQAGQQRTHSNAYPLVVVFDRGDGGEPARKELRSGTYEVGLDAHEARLDLFLEEEGSLISSAK